MLGISHNTSESQARFARKLGLHYPLLADPAGEVARMYGAKGFLPFFSRKTFVVDGRGVIALTHEGMPEVDRILTLLEGLRGDLPGA